MIRRSKRLEHVAPKPLMDDGIDNEDMSETVVPTPEESEGDFPKTKKRKFTQNRTGHAKLPSRKGKGKRGLLKDVVDMPMDVLFEIFEYLEPPDLLHLSRTSKDLRAVLMDRSSISLWKRVFKNVPISGLPDCPKDLTEPQYAELAFNKSCTFCGRKLAIIHIAWEMRVKTCNSCIKEHFRETVYSYAFADIHELIPTIAIYQTGRSRYAKRYALRDTATLLLAEYQSLSNPKAKAAWIKKKIEERDSVRSHAKAYAKWAEIQQAQLKTQKANAIEDRKAIVLDHLREMGWGAELDLIPQGGTGPGDDHTILKFCQKEITSRGLQGMEEYFKSYMEDFKSRRITREQKETLQAKLVNLKEIYSEYLKTLPPDAHYPTTADIFLVARVKEIMYDATNPTLSPEQLDKLRELFPDIIESWPDSIKQRVVESILKDTITFDPTNLWELASTVLQCDRCSSHFSAKEVLRHRCYGTNQYDSSGEHYELFRHISEYPWNGKWKSSKITEKVAKVFEMCSFDPATTIAHLEKVDPIFECLSCHDVERGRCMIRWSGLYNHCRTHMEVLKVIVVEEEIAPKIRERMDEQLERTAVSYRTFMCRYCRTTDRLMRTLAHVKSAHQISRPVPGEDVIINPLANPWHEPFYFWPPRIQEDVEKMVKEMQ